MRSVANASPTHCDMLRKELDTEIPAKPRRSISRAVSSVARRRPGSAIRLTAGKAPVIGEAPSVLDQQTGGRDFIITFVPPAVPKRISINLRKAGSRRS